MLAELGLEQITEDVIVRPMLTIDDAIDLYLGDKARQGRGERTRDTYGRYLEKFCDELPRHWDVAKVGTDDVRRFLDGFVSHSRGTQAQVFSVLKGFFDWLYRNEKIKRSPMERMLAPVKLPAEALSVTNVTTDDVRKMVAEAKTWTEKLSVCVPAYTGCRRSAAAQLRVSDYNPANRTLRFKEKGGKTIDKPVPAELAEMIEASLTDKRSVGWDPTNHHHLGWRDVEPDDYLIPGAPNGGVRRAKTRDDRVVYFAVKNVAERCGIEAHVHALRAAFAVFYLEQNPGDLEALQPLMGHARLDTTQVYLRRLKRETAMERVRGLSWS